MEQLRKLIRKALYERYIPVINENLERVTPEGNAKVRGEKFALSMMEKGAGSMLKISDDDGDREYKAISYALELLIDAFKKTDTEEYIFPTIKQSAKINKKNIIDSIGNAIASMPKEKMRTFLTVVGGKKWNNDAWNNPDVEIVINKAIDSDLVYKSAKDTFASYSADLTSEEMPTNKRIAFYVVSYATKESDKPEASFIYFIAQRINSKISEYFAHIKMGKKVDAKLATHGLERNQMINKKDGGTTSMNTVSYDANIGDGKSFSDVGYGMSVEPAEFELKNKNSKERTADEIYASTALAIPKIYELLKTVNLSKAEIFSLRMQSLKSLNEITDMFINGTLESVAPATHNSVKEYLLKKLGKQPQELTKELVLNNRKFAYDKINNTFKDTKKDNLLGNVLNKVIPIIMDSFSFTPEESAKRAPAIINSIMGEKTGEKKADAIKLSKKKEETRYQKALLTFAVRRESKINAYKKVAKHIDADSFKEYFKDDAILQDRIRIYPDFVKDLMPYISVNTDYEAALKDLNMEDPDAGFIIGDKPYDPYADLDENFIAESSGDIDPDDKFDIKEFSRYMANLLNTTSINEVRKIINKILLKEYFKKQ